MQETNILKILAKKKIPKQDQNTMMIKMTIYER